MSTQPHKSFESLRPPTGPELSRKTTIDHGVFYLERALHDVEDAAKAYLRAQQAAQVETQQTRLDMPQASLASMVVESSANDEDAARQAVEEVFSSAN